MNIGKLTIEMAANVARLRQDMESGRRTVEKATAGMAKAANMAKNAIAGIAAGLTVAAFTGFIRSGINAADVMMKLSRASTVAVSEIGGLQLAFRQAGLAPQDLAMNLARLNKHISQNSDTMKNMGIATKNADGSLRSTREVLGDVADKFKGYTADANRAALAQELFGKSGSSMQNILAGGAETLAYYDDMARKLGLTLSEETAVKAEQFNDTLDLMNQGVRGVSMQIAAEMLPTLTSLVGSLFNTMTQGDRLANTAKVLGNILRGLYTIAVGVVEVFSTLGKTIGGVIAATVAAASGDFSVAKNILSDMKRDIGEGWKNTLTDITKAWEQNGDAGVTALAAISSQATQTAPAITKIAKATKKAKDEWQAWIDKMEEDAVNYRLKLHEKKLDEQEKQDAEYYAEIKRFEDDATAYRLKLHEKRLIAEEKAQEEQVKNAKNALEKQQEANDKMADQLSQAVTNALMQGFESGKGFAENLGDSIVNMFKTWVARMITNAIKNAILSAMAQTQWGRMLSGITGGGGNGFSITDAYSAYSNFSAGGGGNMGAVSGWATGGMSTANMLGSVYANTMTTGMATSSIAASGAGIDALLATNAAYGTAASTGAAAGASAGAAAGATAGASAGTAGATAGLAAVPVWGWIALAVMALWEPMFGSKMKEQGKAGNFDGAGGIATSKYTHRQGGWFSSNKTIYEDLHDNGAFARQLKGVQDGMIETARVMGLGEEAIRSFAGSINIDLRGLNAEEAMKKTKEEMTKLQAQMLATASFTPEVVKSFEEIEAAALEMGLNAEEAASHAREVTARDDALKRQGFEQMTNYYISLINQTEQVMAQAGITSQALADVIIAGMTGRMDQSQVGAALADIVLGGIYNTIAGGFAAQIADIFMQQIIQPIMMAVTAGVPLTTAISQQAMTAVVAQAQQSAAILKAIFDDPVFKQVMADLQTTIGGISSAVVRPARSIQAFGSAALAAGQAAEQAAEAMKRERYGLETRLLELQGNTAELRRRELLQLHPTNRALQQHIWALEDQQKAAAEAARMAQELRNTWKQLGDSIVDEIRRIRGEMLGTSPEGQAALQAEFAMLTARARAGDTEAAGRLPEVSRALIEMAKQNASSLSDFRFIQGSTLASLAETLALIKRFTSQAMPKPNIQIVDTPQTVRDSGSVVKPHEPEYVSAQSKNSVQGDSELLAELKALRKEMSMYKSAQAAQTVATTSMEDMLRRVSNNGGFIRTMEVTP